LFLLLWLLLQVVESVLAVVLPLARFVLEKREALQLDDESDDGGHGMGHDDELEEEKEEGRRRRH